MTRAETSVGYRSHMTDDDIAPVPAIAALSAFFLTIIAGVGMGFLVSAAVVEEGFSTRYAVMTERPMNFVTSTFNWLIFAMFAAAAFVAAAAAWAGSSVARAHWLTRQAQRAKAAQPAPTNRLDPPHL